LVQELHKKVDTMQKNYYALRGKIRDTERCIITLSEHLDMRDKLEKNKGIHSQLVSLKPKQKAAFAERHRAELTLYESATRYLTELQKSGEKIAPKWGGVYELRSDSNRWKISIYLSRRRIP